MLKKLVPVLGLLAFVAGPVLAADAPSTSTTSTSTHKSTHKASTHHMHKHHKKAPKNS